MMEHKGFVDARPRVYLAGPDVFMSNAIEIGQRKKALCKTYGFEGVFPFDAEVEMLEGVGQLTGLAISNANERLISSCQYVIANATAFRGPSVDVGTAFEMGYARALGLVVYAYTNTGGKYADRVMAASRIGLNRDPAGRLLDRNGMSVEEWGFFDNLMVEGCIISSGGSLVVNDVAADCKFEHLAGFEKCLQLMSQRRTEGPTAHGQLTASGR